MSRASRYSGKDSEFLTSPTPYQLHPTHAERIAEGKSWREKCPRKSHGHWRPPHNRDPIELLEASSQGRISQLIPVRYGRMMKSPLTWYRGVAMNMAADLAGAPVTGQRVQACGDAHLCNFGSFATPERRVIFDINDLDETLPAPWEWDVKRLAASFVLACRNNGFSEETARDAAQRSVRAYREHMAAFSQMRVLDTWYCSIDLQTLLDGVDDDEARSRGEKRLAKARERSVLEHDFPELAHTDGLAPTIRENPPLIYHWRETGHEEHLANVQQAFAGYRESLSEHRRVLLDQFQLLDIAVKVVGVGSVGTLCAVMLLLASENDPLFLQVKEARPSVLEPYAGRSSYANHGQRVVAGCQLMQSASDLFLGWTKGVNGNHFYVRQLRDVKIKMLVDVFTPSVMMQYADACGSCLARAHARSGDSAKIAGYLGAAESFDAAVADFSIAYADQSERDHELMVKAVRAGKLEVFVEAE